MAKVEENVRPRCLIVAGPNGAGKTTFAQEYLPSDVRVLNFINADLIAGGLSPLKPEVAAIAAGRLVLKEIDRLVEARADFAFESTLSGLGDVSRHEAEGLSHRDHLPQDCFDSTCCGPYQVQSAARRA